MLNFEDIAKKICGKFPKGVSHAKDDLEKTVKSVLQSTFAKLNLVTREEFDSQVKLLAKLRKRVDVLEEEVQKLSGKKAKTTKTVSKPKAKTAKTTKQK